MDKRARARALAAEHLAKNDPTGWFEPLYREARQGSAKAADTRPETAKELADSSRGEFDTADVLRGFLNSAKGTAASHQTEKEPASSSGGTRDSGPVLRGFLDSVSIPWADLQPNPKLIDFWQKSPLPSVGRTAITIGCGLGDDAEQLAAWGFVTTAFDISASAIAMCSERFPDTKVQYVPADLLHPPPRWSGSFDFVFEANTVQVLPASLRVRCLEQVASFVKTNGYLLLITRGRNTEDDPGQMPWPLTRVELNVLRELGLREISFEDYFDRETPPVRRFGALYQRE